MFFYSIRYSLDESWQSRALYFESCKKNSHSQHLSQVALTRLCFAHHGPFCISFLRCSTTAYLSSLVKGFPLSFAHYSMPVCQYNLYSLLVKSCFRVFSKSCCLLNELYCSSLKSISFILKKMITPVQFTKTLLSLHSVRTSSIGCSSVVKSFNNMLSRRRVIALTKRGYSVEVFWSGKCSS